jgi:serine/threonine protein phosphatase PrpC
MHEAALRTGGATTFTGIAVTPDGNFNYLHVGDTVLLRVRQSGVETLTTEQIYGDFRRHVLYNYLGNSGYIDPTTGESWDTERQPKLTPRPGMKARPLMMEAEWGARPLRDGDRIILASDGVMEDREHHLISYPELVRRTSLSLGALASAQAMTKEPTKVDDLIASVIDFRKSK